MVQQNAPTNATLPPQLYNIKQNNCPANLNNCPRRVHDDYGQFAYRVRNARLELLRTDLGKSEEPDRSLL